MNVRADIVAASCVLPSGPTLPLADAALRAQFALLRRHPFYVDRCGIPVKASYFPGPAFALDAHRWCSLASSALGELVNRLSPSPALGGRACDLWLVLPRSDRPGVPPDLSDRMMAILRHHQLPARQIRTIRGGHAVGVHALRQASQAATQAQSLTVVLAVDSWLHPEALEYLEIDRRLHGAHASYEGQPRPNPYGRVPGEGAAALALLPRAPRRHRRLPADLPPWAAIAGAALAEERLTFDSAGPCVGRGLTQAASQALGRSRCEARGIGHLSADLNGEPYRADEFGFSMLNLAAALAPDCQRSTPALVSGDLGAASAICQIALAAYRIHHRPSRDPASQLILCSSDDPLRAAVVLDAPSPRH